MMMTMKMRTRDVNCGHLMFIPMKLARRLPRKRKVEFLTQNKLREKFLVGHINVARKRECKKIQAHRCQFCYKLFTCKVQDSITSCDCPDVHGKRYYTENCYSIK